MSSLSSPPPSPAATSVGAAYDALPYVSRSLPQTHPDALAVAARLYGMTPAPVDKCRVLELGCATGGNLLPLAASLPESRFLGIDLSPRQIAEGALVIKELSLSNIELRAVDLMKVDLGQGPDGLFDYIICHGVYSWVAPPVQERILEICQQHLSPQGVAYISYNTYPGFYKRQPFRDMLRYHTAALTDPLEAAKQGRMLLEFLLQNVGDANSTYAVLLRDELEKMRGLPLSYISHDLLEADNRPLYFHEFMSAASAHRLQFLAEAEGKGGIELLSEAAQKALAGFENDIVRREQYIDFLRNSSLRSTLLVRAELPLKRDLHPQQIHSFLLRSLAQPEQEIKDVHASEPASFRSRLGSVTVEHPAFKSLLWGLYRARPHALPASELAVRVSEILKDPVSPDDVTEMALYAYRMGLVALHTRRPALPEHIAVKPRASSLARLQANQKQAVTNLWHEPLALDPLERQLLLRLDGKTDKTALFTAVLSDIEQGLLTKHPNLPDLAKAGDWLPDLLPQILSHFFAVALLVA